MKPLHLLTALAALSASAQASATDDLSRALLRTRTFAVGGQVEVTVLFPPRSVPTQQTHALPQVPFRPQLLNRNFNVTQTGSAQVAGRPALRYELTPKVGQAARWTLWIDPVWNLPLGFEERQASGEVTRRAQFLKVNGAPQKRQTPVPTAPAGLRAAVLRALPGLHFPPGFVPVAVKPRAKAGYVVTLSDGVNLLALTTAPRPIQPAAGVASRRVGSRAVWLVGNLPSAVLEQALSGIRSLDEGPLLTF